MYTRKKKESKLNDLRFHLKKLGEKKEKIKPELNIRNKITKIRA